MRLAAPEVVCEMANRVGQVQGCPWDVPPDAVRAGEPPRGCFKGAQVALKRTTRYAGVIDMRTNRRRNEPIIDALPEFFSYRDNGCEVSVSCLGCHLPRCKFDDPGWFRKAERDQRDTEVLRARRSTGSSVPELARRFGVSQRTIHRILSAERRGKV